MTEKKQDEQDDTAARLERIEAALARPVVPEPLTRSRARETMRRGYRATEAAAEAAPDDASFLERQRARRAGS